MNVLKDIKALSLPWSTRLFVLAVLVFASVVNLGLFGFGLIMRRHELLAATVQFFGILLPVILIVTVLARADSGVSGLKRRTELLFTSLLPSVLASLVETPQPFYAPDPRRRPPRSEARTRVFVNLARAECQAEIALLSPLDGGAGWRLVLIRLEVTAARINFNLCIPADLVDGDSRTVLHQCFRHTLEGAAASGPADADGRLQTGYSFLATPMVRIFEGREHLCLVGGKFVTRDFLWDSAEQLYFAQDLLFMLRAFVSEAPSCFLVIDGETAPGPDAVRAALRAPTRTADTHRRERDGLQG